MSTTEGTAKSVLSSDAIAFGGFAQSQAVAAHRDPREAGSLASTKSSQSHAQAERQWHAQSAQQVVPGDGRRQTFVSAMGCDSRSDSFCRTTNARRDIVSFHLTRKWQCRLRDIR